MASSSDGMPGAASRQLAGQVQQVSGAAMKILLAELRQTGIDAEGFLICTALRQRLKRVWLQGYVLCRDGDDVVDLDDGSAVMSASPTMAEVDFLPAARAP
ncbi:unnamed protein product [Effrenium voratum]|nr:unnamed protein product [Effrenium voratum]